MENELRNNSGKKSLFYAFLATLISAGIMVACVFLPYGSANEEYANVIRENPDVILDEEFGVTAGEMLHISMVEFAMYYSGLSEQIWGDSYSGYLYVVLVFLIGGFAFLAALFALLKKPIVVLVFNILALGAFSMQNWDFSDRGVIPGSSYDWGMGYYIFYIAAAATFVAAVWMLVVKLRIKRTTGKMETLD